MACRELQCFYQDSSRDFSAPKRFTGTHISNIASSTSKDQQAIYFLLLLGLQAVVCT